MKATTNEIEVIWYSPRPLPEPPTLEFRFRHFALWDDLIRHIQRGNCSVTDRVLVVLDAACHDVPKIFFQYEQLKQKSPRVFCSMLYAKTFDIQEVWAFIQRSLQSLTILGECGHDQRCQPSPRTEV